MGSLTTLDTTQDAQRDARAFIADLYIAMLGREPDEAGLKHHMSRLLNGTPRTELIDHFLNSKEFFNRITKQAYARSAGQENPMQSPFPADYSPPGEAGRCYLRRLRSGFFDRYCSGDLVLDVGFSGYDNPESKAALPNALGIDLDYPGYDGITLPFADGSADTVMSSHCLEHILYDHAAIRDWYRVLKIGGFIVCMVPHQGLYEKRRFLPSQWNTDHKRMYTPASLLQSFEQALQLNTYRVRHLADNDTGFNYALGPDMHSEGAYEIELVIEKITPPDWKLA